MVLSFFYHIFFYHIFVPSKLVSYTDSSNEEEEDLHVDVNFDEPIDLAIN